MKRHEIEDSWLKFFIVAPFATLIAVWLCLWIANEVFGFKDERLKLENACKDHGGQYIYIKGNGMTCIQGIINL